LELHGGFPELMSVWQGGSTNATTPVPLSQLSHSSSSGLYSVTSAINSSSE
jgi:hypothetical protein